MKISTYFVSFMTVSPASGTDTDTMMTTNTYVEENYCRKQATTPLPSRSVESGRPLPATPSYELLRVFSLANKCIVPLVGQRTNSYPNCPILPGPVSSVSVRTWRQRQESHPSLSAPSGVVHIHIPPVHTHHGNHRP